jgi:nucleotide-binding universal stress UspA family protein
MPIRDIILHQGPDSRSEARLDIAAALAKAHDARVICVFVKVDPGNAEYWWMATGKGALAGWLSALEKICEDAEEAFEKRMTEDGLEGEWRVMDGNPTDAMMTCARYGDLTVIGQANPDEPAYDSAMPDQLVLGAGGPVLVVPYVGHFETIGRRIMVAWNGEREAARAVRDAMPILERAETVIVCNIDPSDEGRFAGADVCAHLARHGVRAEASHIVLGPEEKAVSSVLQTVGGFGFQERGPWSQTQRPPIGKLDAGNALLSAVTDCGADLLVMGAYGHSRIRELALGGTTREILGTMTVPVLMSN